MYSALSCPALASLPFFSAADHGKRIGPIYTSPRALGASFHHPCRTVAQKSPRNPRRSGQKAPSRRDLSIGTRHAARDRPEGEVTKMAHAFSAHVLYISELVPRAWSGKTGVVNSLKLENPRQKCGQSWLDVFSEREVLRCLTPTPTS